MEPIQININRVRDGCYYELHPSSRRRIKEAYPDVRVAPMVFVGYESKDDFEAIQGPMWQQIAVSLAGISWEKLLELGGVVLFDIRSEDIRPVSRRTAA